MSSLQHTVGLAGFELRGVTRSRWVAVGAAVFAAAAVAVTLAGLRSFSALGLAGAGAATDGLVHVALLLPPLIGLLLGAGSLARHRDSGTLSLLASQPVRRGLLPLSAFVGSTLAVWAVVALGLGAGTLLLSTVATVADLFAVATVLGVSLAATAISVALGVAISSVASSHNQATAAAASLWLLLALGLDLLLAGVAPGLRLGAEGLLVAVLVNPLEAARVLVLLVLDDGAALGPFGAYLTDAFGRSGALGLLGGGLGFWLVAPLAYASLTIGRRDV